MRAPWKRAAILALATCSFSIVSGCKTDVDKADDAVANELSQASSSLSLGHPDKAIQTLAQSATKGSSLSKVESNLLIAQAQCQAADALLQKAWQQETKISARLLELDRIGTQITSNNGNLAGFQALNPTAGQQAFDQVSTAAEKGEGGAWVKGEAPVPSLANVKEREDKLNAQIADLTKQRTESAAKRALALQQSENFARQADSTTGSNSTGFYIQASNQRKEAGDAEVKMRDLDGQIQPLQQQLDIAKEQEQSIQATLASIKDQVGKLQTGWQGVQKQMDQLKEFSASLVGAAGAGTGAAAGATSQPAEGLNAIATDLNEQVKAATDLRAQAAALLNEAYKHLTEAQKQAGDVIKSIPQVNTADARKVPEKAAWQDLIALNDPAEFKVRQAEVLGRLARLYSGQYMNLSQRNAVARLLDSALKQAGVESPAAAALGNGGAPTPAVREAADKILAAINSGSFAGYLEQASEFDNMAGGQATPSDQELIAAVRADFYYSWAESVATEVIGGASQGDLQQLRVNIAHLLRMTNQYAWSQMGTVQNKATDAKGRLAIAMSERKLLAENPAGKAMLPPMLPPELAEVVTSQPAAQPGGAEATSQPATTEAATTGPAGSPGTASVDSPEQAAVRAVGLAFIDAVSAGDLEKAKVMVVVDGIEFRTFANFLGAYASFRTASAEKFGDAVQAIPSPIPDLHDKIQTGPVVINGIAAAFTSPGDKDVMKMQSVNGVWKVDFSSGPNAQITAQLQVLTLLNGVYTRAKTATQAGKFKTWDELKQSLMADMKMSVPNFTPPTTAPAQSMPAQ